jgi:hypothetical protein
MVIPQWREDQRIGARHKAKYDNPEHLADRISFQYSIILLSQFRSQARVRSVPRDLADSNI